MGGFEGASGPAGMKGMISKMARSAPGVGVPHSKGDLTGYSPAACRAYAQPTAACGTGSSVARHSTAAGFGAFALLDSGLTQLGFRFWGLGFMVWGLGFRSLGLGLWMI